MKLSNVFSTIAAHVYWLLNKDDIQYHAWRETMIVRVMAVLPAYSRYHAKPTFEQVRALVDEIETTTIHNVTSLCETLAAGNIPEDVDTIIARHAQGWTPVEEKSK